MQRIFITRNLKADSPFLNALTGYRFKVEGHSLICFEAVPFKGIPEVDWIFFYSGKAVTFFFRHVKKTGLTLAADLKWGAIGPATAAALQEWGVCVNFAGTGEPNDTASHFLSRSKGKRVLFPRAAQSRQSIQQILQGQIEVFDLIVYQNTIDAKAQRPQADILVFTSPLNAHAYFEHSPPETVAKIIAIGSTTAAALQKLGVKNIMIAPEPSEEGLAQAVVLAMGS